MTATPSRLTLAAVALCATFAMFANSCADDDRGTPSSTSAAGVAATGVPETSSTSTSVPPATATRVPGAEWISVSPDDVDLDPSVLGEVAETASAGNSRCLVVARDGVLAGEWYFEGSTAESTQNVFSVTKSVTSVLVGIAQADGVLDIEQSASTWIPEWKGTPSEAVTVRDLLSNDSGREWSVAIHYGQLLRSKDTTGFAIGLGQAAAPGEVWAYNNSAIQTLERVLESATGVDVATFAEERLFGPLGMTQTRMATDAAGNTQVFQGVRSSCRDLARFGTMLLNRGAWGDRQIVPAAWIDQATGRSSSSLNAAYGYLFWLNRPGTIASPLVAAGVGQPAEAATDGQVAAGAPDDIFWAIGFGNQIVQVDPGSRTVVVRLGAAVRPEPPTFGPVEASRVVTDAVTGS